MIRKALKILAAVGGIVVGLFVLLILFATLRWDAPVHRRVPQLSAPIDSATIARGEFLYGKSLTCWQCHTSGQEDRSAPSGGFRFDLTTLSPSLGVYYAANITPDVETGIGGWTDGEVVRAIREGIRKDGTVLFPIMPVDALNGLSDDDALALVAYLRSLPPVKHTVPRKEPSLFAKVLQSLGVIGAAPEITQPISAPDRSITFSYGEYIVRHASLCTDCHTPRNLQTGEFYYDSLLAGSSFAYGDDEGSAVLSFAPNITPDPETGIGGWTEDQFLTMMSTGMGPDGKVRVRHMPYGYYGLWDSLELRSVYRYIKEIKPIHRPTPEKAFVGDLVSSDPLTRGRGHFESICSGCHGKDGKGAAPTNVALAEVASSLDDADLLDFISAGQPDLRMPSFAKTLSKGDLNAVVSYIRSWNETAATRE